MTKEELDAIRKRCEKASPGPWYVVNIDKSKPNAEFMAHAREDIPKLLEEIERLRGALDRAVEIAKQTDSDVYVNVRNKPLLIVLDWEPDPNGGQAKWTNAVGVSPGQMIDVTSIGLQKQANL
jgi:hypothetical protein